MAPAFGDSIRHGDADFAADAARALLIASGTDAAKPWLDAANAPELRFLAWLAGAAPADQINPGALFKAAVVSLASHNSGAAPAEADLMVALADGAGRQPRAARLGAARRAAARGKAAERRTHRRSAAGRDGERSGE